MLLTFAQAPKALFLLAHQVTKEKSKALSMYIYIYTFDQDCKKVERACIQYIVSTTLYLQFHDLSPPTISFRYSFRWTFCEMVWLPLWHLLFCPRTRCICCKWNVNLLCLIISAPADLHGLGAVQVWKGTVGVGLLWWYVDGVRGEGWIEKYKWNRK